MWRTTRCFLFWGRGGVDSICFFYLIIILCLALDYSFIIICFYDYFAECEIGV